MQHFVIKNFYFKIYIYPCLLGLFVLVMIYISLPSQVLASNATDKLVGYWKMDETSAGSSVVDSSGDGNNGTPSGAGGSQNGPQPNSSVPTMSYSDPRSLNFDGTDDDVAVSGLLTGSSQTVTLAAWVNLTTKDTSGAEIISLGDHVLIRADDSTSQKTTGQFYNGTTWIGTGSGVDIAGSGWRHVAYVVNQVSGNFYQQIYIDGVLDTQSTNNTSIVYSGQSQNTKIGEHGNGSANYNFNGKIDDLRVYTRALSADEIADLAAGRHTAATWDGSSSTNNETAANWDINAVPDAYTRLIIANSGSQPSLTTNLTSASLTINNGATLTTNCFTLSYNDGGSLTNNGTLINCPSTSQPLTAASPGKSSPSCNSSTPAKAPVLFQADKMGNNITLHFTTVANATGYGVEYTEEPNIFRYGDLFNYNGPAWTNSRTIHKLASNTTYYFRIRAVNGCTAGEWSKTLKVNTIKNSTLQKFFP